MKPRIVILSAFLSPFRSGAEACAEEVPLALVDQYDFTIVTARGRRSLPKRDRLQGKINVVRVGLGLGLGIDKWLFPFLAPFAVRRLRPQLIHAVLETFAGLALVFCQWLVPSARRLLTLQTTNRSFLKGMIVRSPDQVTAISSPLQRQAQEWRAQDVPLIPNGINADRFFVSAQRKIPGRILFVGRLEPMKGVDVLLRACARLSGEWSLHVVGDGSQRGKLTALAAALGVADRVTFVGYVPPNKVHDAYAQAEIFCGLSSSEALGNVFLEAQAAGCAVLATRVGGIPDIVKDGVTGILVPSGDIDSVREVLSRFLADSELCNRLSHAAVQHALQYDWHSIAERYSALYDHLLSRTS